MKKGRMNTQVLLEVLCYLAFAGVLLYTVISGKYLSYVTPRIKPYICFAAVVLVLWAAVSLKSLFRAQYRKHTLHCLILIIPMILLVLPGGQTASISQSGSTGLVKGMPKSIMQTAPTSDVPNASADSSRPSSSSEISQNDSDSSEKQDSLPDSDENASKDTLSTKDAYGKVIRLHGYDSKNKSITISNEEFLQWTDVLFNNMNEYIGWNVTVTGSVYKDPQYLAENEFVPARLLMTCCVADLVPYGIVCKYDQVDQLKADKWVTVTGTVFKEKYQGQDEPQLKVTSVRPAQAVEGYLYPY